jgi:hypothetical protein
MNDRVSMPRITVVIAFVLGLAGLGAARVARADSPATTRAARLNFMQGTVTVTEGGNAPVPAQMNLPLLQGVQLATGADGQAEIEFEDGSVVRLTPNSALSLDSLAVEPGGVFTTGMSLLGGLAYVELRAAPQYQYTLNAGGDVLSPVENTTVRVNFDEPPAIFSVLDGTAEVERQGGYQAQVRAGESFRADPTDATRFSLTEEIAEDSWDQWNEDRDQAAAAAAGDQTAVRDDYAGAQGYGWSDLDADGSWYNVPGQGPVWQPDAAADAGFDPYGNGAWVWYPGTGYVWASGYSWGWTPYRCGNWSFYGGFGWGWLPGAGCGGFGWGFYGGGAVVNIGLIPRGYRPIRVPIGGVGPRPILPVRGTGREVATGAMTNGPRQIAGVTVAPIQPVRRGYVSGGAVVGSALERDYPIDGATKTPVLGLASTRPAVIHTTTGWKPAAAQTGGSAAGAGASAAGEGYSGRSNVGQQGTGQAGGQGRPSTAPAAPTAPVARPTPAYGQTPRPPQQTGQQTPQQAPPPRSSAPPPQQQAAPRYSPPPSPPRPTYTPAPRPPSPPAAHSAPASHPK